MRRRELRPPLLTHLRHRLCITEVEMMLICAGTKSNSSPPPRPYGVRVLSRAPVPMRCVFWDLTGEAALERSARALLESRRLGGIRDRHTTVDTRAPCSENGPRDARPARRLILNGPPYARTRQ